VHLESCQEGDGSERQDVHAEFKPTLERVSRLLGLWEVEPRAAPSNDFTQFLRQLISVTSDGDEPKLLQNHLRAWDCYGDITAINLAAY